MSDSIGTFGAIVWPTYVGAVLVNGQEPITDFRYARGSITWTPEGDDFLGSATILVPEGDWGWIIYCYDPVKPNFIASQRLHSPILLAAAGDITLKRITKEDFHIENQALRVRGILH